MRDRGDKTIRGGVIVGVPFQKFGKSGQQWGIFSGAIIAFVGLIILLENMGFHVAGYVFRFWPLSLIIFGAWSLACRSSRVFGGVLIVIGALFQLDELGIAHIHWAQLWPLAIIAAGLLVMWSSVEARKISEKLGNAFPVDSQSDPRTTLNEVALFAGIERRLTTKDFQGGRAQALFGGIELDLRDADMQKEEVVLQLEAVFGGIEMRIPDTWQVVSRGQAFFGGFVDSTRTYASNPAEGPGKKSLILTGSAVFGGVEIKN